MIEAVREVGRKTTPLWLRKKMVQIMGERASDLAWRWSDTGRRSRRQLALYRDRHVGQRCFILGNGPSLKRMDLTQLRDEATFGLNRIYLLFPALGFATTYLAAVNPLVVEQCAGAIAALTMPRFVSVAGQRFLPIRPDIVFLRTRGGPPQFSLRPERLVWESNTVTFVALQLAYFMGFAEVILIGVDHHFETTGEPNAIVVSQGGDPDHFDPDYFGPGFRWQLPDLARSEIGYRLARDAFAASGRRVLDATVGGKLNVFPKVAYESLFS